MQAIRPRSFGAALCVALAAALCGPGSAGATPTLPAGDDEVIERLPVRSDQGIDLGRLHAALAREPDNLDFAVQVAQRDLDYGGPRFDPRYTGHAQAALAPWWNDPDPPAAVRLLRATIRQRNHDFAGALVDLDAVLARQPQNPQALLIRAAVRQVRGEYDQAAADCATLLQAGAGLAGIGCAQAVAALQGDAPAAYAALLAAYERAWASDGVRVWVLGILAETAARLDDAAAAERHLRAALALRPDDGYTLAAFADFLLDQQRPAEVVTLLAERTAVDPLLLRLAIAERAVDRAAAAPHIAALADRFATAAARGESVNRREEARFALEVLAEPKRALGLAAANWQVQREPADARLLLQAALAAADPAAARPALAWLVATGFDHPAFRRLAAALAALPPG